jgi:hypothetical protein
MRLPTVAATILFAALTGCSGSNQSNVPEINAGDCIAKDVADADDRAPDLTSVVDCSKPHVYEIIDLVDIPKNALSGKTDKEKLANRMDLATVEDKGKPSTEKVAFSAWVETGCDTAWAESNGYDDITVNGVSATDARVLPAVGPSINLPWFNVMSKEQWLAGNRQLICSARFVGPGEGSMEEAGPVKPLSSTNDKPLLSVLGSPSFPAGLRSCNYFQACDQQHHTETLFLFDAQSALDEKFVEGIDAKKQTDKQLKELDRVCAEALPTLMSDNYDKSKIKSEAFVGVPWEDYYKNVGCGIVPTDSQKDFGPGAMVWTDGTDVTLVDAKK